MLYIKIRSNAGKPWELVITHGETIRKPSVNTSDEAVTGQIPFILPPASVPCRINCVNFDRGGEGVAFHKNVVSENGLYRTDGVEIELSDDTGAGYNVKNIVSSEWLEYTVNVCEKGDYLLKLRVQGKGTISVDFDEKESSEKTAIDESRWNTADLGKVKLSAGEQVMRISVYDGSLRLNWAEVVKE